MAGVEGDGTTLYFGEIAGYWAPGWPSDSKQFHLDLRAPDPEALVDRVSQLGGSKPEFQPGESWIVLLEPAGHPFCISRAACPAPRSIGRTSAGRTPDRAPHTRPIRSNTSSRTSRTPPQHGIQGGGKAE